MEHFYTLQGEGAYVGHAAYFVRLGGCDVGCHWCDVKESWDAEAHPKLTVEQVVTNIKESQTKIAVITGGEPLMHDCDPLTQEIKSIGVRTHIETSGSSKLSGEWDWVCLSPKKFKPPVEEIYKEAHELKIVVFNKSDFEWAEEHAKQVSANCKLYLQPEWSKREQIMPLIVEYIKLYPQWTMSLQTHKYLNIP
ncbi:MAG: 7-carboxy-7-deazaguanine synthase QueE [Bacteroidetes bacterium]|nr:7-carboxy-7-deazaguanine synthase QueE [Bacteroidota bacterium]